MYTEILRVTDKYDAILRDGDLNEIGRLKVALSWYSSGAVDVETEPRRVVPDVIQRHSLDEGLVLDWLDYRIPVMISGAFLRIGGTPKRDANSGKWEALDWKTFFTNVPA